MTAPPPPSSATVAQSLKDSFAELTPSERCLANVILENYPVSGIGSITELADSAGISTPTVARMAKKLGFSGFPQLQLALRHELERQFANPISKRDSWHSSAPRAHILNSLTDAVIANMRQTLGQLDLADFEQVCSLLSNPKHKVIVAGGRLTHTLADHLRMHLQMMRPSVSSFQMNSNTWPHALIDCHQDDVLVIFDIRRYETTAARLAEMAHKRKVKVVLFTDQWQSPVSEYADLTIAAFIEAPSAWDSSIAIMLVIDAILAQVQEKNWPLTRARMELLEEVLDEAKLFRRFPGKSSKKFRSSPDET